MGLFKKNKGTRLGDGERKKGREQLKDILENGPGENEPLGVTKASPKARNGFFKSQSFRRKNKFHRLSSSAGTPRNGYEPPNNVAVFFSDDGSVAASSLTQTTAGYEFVEKPLNTRFIKASVSKDQASKMIKNLTSGKETKTPDGFQKLNDDESLYPKGTVSFDSDGFDDALAVSTLEPRKSQVNKEQTLTQKKSDGNYDFDCLLQTNLPFSDLMDSKSSGSVGESKSFETGDSVKKPSHLVLDEKSTAESTVEKFSEAGSSEFRQFVFDKKFSRIETVAVEKSDSGVGETFMSAAAILTSKLTRSQAGVIDQFSPSPGFPRSTPNSNNRQSFHAGESPANIKFPSPRFPSPSISKKSGSQHAYKASSPFTKNQQPQFSSPQMETKENDQVANKVSNDCSDPLIRKEDIPIVEKSGVPPDAILTSSEQTIVSNMSATHATAETSVHISENAYPFNAFRPASGIPEANEQDEDDTDPFHVGTLSENDDTLWEPSEDPFDCASPGQINQSMSRDNNTLIDSIRKASSRDQSSVVHRPDPSPKSITAPVPDPEGTKTRRTTLKHVEKHMDKHMESMYNKLQQKTTEEPKENAEDNHNEGTDENAMEVGVWSDMRRESEDGRPSRPSPSTPESLPGKQYGIAKKEQFFAGNISRDDRLPFSPSSFQNRSRADRPRMTNPGFILQDKSQPRNKLEDHFSTFNEAKEKFHSRGNVSVKSNPSGVPSSAIAASMLFQTAHSQTSSKAAPPPPNSVAKDRDHAKNMPPDVEFDQIETVSSITEEASTFYKNNFQMWSRTATDALNKIQKGAFPRNPNSYQYGHNQ